MSRWTHNICDDCWDQKYPERKAIRLRSEYRETEVCCFCSKETRSGIYVRENPADLACNGNHKDDE